MTVCLNYDPENVYKRLKVVEFPICIVGLSISKIIDIEESDLYTSAYLKTMCQGALMKFEEARDISASHRAFKIIMVDNHTIEVTFKPTNECIERAKQLKDFDNRFVVDLRLIQVDGTLCCDNELHAEISRYYICGKFEHVRILHEPKILDFSQVTLNKKVTKYIRIRNESTFVTAKFNYQKAVGIHISPQIFSILPFSSQNLSVTVKPNSLKVGHQIVFYIKNAINLSDTILMDKNTANNDNNFMPYIVNCKVKVVYPIKTCAVYIKSLHTLNELNPTYTFVSDEVSKVKEYRKKAYEFFVMSKLNTKKKTISASKESIIGKDKCYVDLRSTPSSPRNFLKADSKIFSIYDVFLITPYPAMVDFGRVGLCSYAKKVLTFKNCSSFDITLHFYHNEYIFYTEKKVRTLKIYVKSLSEVKVTLFCSAFIEGIYTGNFEYSINQKYFRKYMYTLQTGNPTLMLPEKKLKFGMVTSDFYTTSSSVKVYNHFNVDIDFNWSFPQNDTPFEVIPNTSLVPGNSCRMCDIIYKCLPTKLKTFEIDFNFGKKTVPVELNIITRKLSVKFLQPSLTFYNIGLNLEITKKVFLENSTRELAFFCVVEPLLPGFRIEPMSGKIYPKMILTFDVIVKISCVIEFTFDIILKINNKENVMLPVSGNVVEPKINIQPKNVCMPRIPCNMSTYIQVTLRNISYARIEIDVLNMNDENVFKVYINKGNENYRVSKLNIDAGQSETIFIQVYGMHRKEYDYYMPFRINGLIGPPDNNPESHDMRYYVQKHEQFYANNSKVKIKPVCKEISFCHLMGVITLPWLTFSPENFQIVYDHNSTNSIDFTMRNVSKYNLHITILTSKLIPNFSLHLLSKENIKNTCDNQIKFELISLKEAQFCLKFHPKDHGKFITTALLYLDVNMTTPYYNLTFIGVNEIPTIKPSTFQIIMPPAYVGEKVSKIITLNINSQLDLCLISFISSEPNVVTVKFLDYNIHNEMENKTTSIQAEITVCSHVKYISTTVVTFKHKSGSSCDIKVKYCFSCCPLTLHTASYVKLEDNPYPFYPISIQVGFYNYMETCLKFLEKWLFYQGFRKDLYPKIPETFHTVSDSTPSQNKTKSKGINVSYLNFIKKLAGPMIKHAHKVTMSNKDETIQQVKEVYAMYKEVINLLKSRGANLWAVKPKFLLSYDQFVTFIENIPPKCIADEFFDQELLNNTTLFERLNKQCWIDFILQSYKVFVLESCFFDCICDSTQSRDIVNILITWYNEQLLIYSNTFSLKSGTVKCIKNITNDLSDGIAIIATFLNYCPFLNEHFSLKSHENECKCQSGIINNACLIIEAVNQLRLNFPLTSKDFLEPNFLQMLFLSIHLYVILPMFKPKENISFNPPLLRSSTRKITITPTSQESLNFNTVLFYNKKSGFVVEKTFDVDNTKRVIVSVTFIANFVSEQKSILLVHGYNKTRIFDTYIIFILSGSVGTMTPLRKCKVTGPSYRPQKVDILVSSPFMITATYRISITDKEPSASLDIREDTKYKFYARRLNLTDKEVVLTGIPKESGQDVLEHKIHFHLICLDTQIRNTWVWFRSEIGEFFIKVTSQPRCEIVTDTVYAHIDKWPLIPCSCSETCECYRTTALTIPHRNDLMIKSLRCALLENASEKMIEIFDELVETATGRIILSMLLVEGGTNMSEVRHILRNETSFLVTAHALELGFDRVTLAQHTDATLVLPITVPVHNKSEKYSVTFTSECGMDVRAYRVLFIENEEERE
ncbi:unnamed protein product [Parnassius mnemosyne]|uniref:Calponin-homology (CH) domain-containing protein n=1 Tax=Parnassius mnemosyne TaxID=213953 RepID=A0AAV1M9Q8_9NEOP